MSERCKCLLCSVIQVQYYDYTIYTFNTVTIETVSHNCTRICTDTQFRHQLYLVNFIVGYHLQNFRKYHFQKLTVLELHYKISAHSKTELVLFFIYCVLLPYLSACKKSEVFEGVRGTYGQKLISWTPYSRGHRYGSSLTIYNFANG